jgi:hypothetical protein
MFPLLTVDLQRACHIIIVFWVMTPFSLVGSYHYFGVLMFYLFVIYLITVCTSDYIASNDEVIS